MPTCFVDELCVPAGAAISIDASVVPKVPTHHECQPSFVTVLYSDVEKGKQIVVYNLFSAQQI